MIVNKAKDYRDKISFDINFLNGFILNPLNWQKPLKFALYISHDAKGYIPSM